MSRTYFYEANLLLYYQPVFWAIPASMTTSFYEVNVLLWTKSSMTHFFFKEAYFLWATPFSLSYIVNEQISFCQLFLIPASVRHTGFCEAYLLLYGVSTSMRHTCFYKEYFYEAYLRLWSLPDIFDVYTSMRYYIFYDTFLTL